MAFYDWNGDTKKDFTDDFIEYNVYKNSTGGSSKSSGSLSDRWIWLILAIVTGVCPPIGAIIFLGILIFG